ncbi:hypothetical protein diail_11604, partial [Diaporthe ilicicola]
MPSNVNKRLRKIAERPRTYADVSKPNLAMNEIKYKVVHATMEMLSILKTVSDMSTYTKVAGYYMTVANSAPWVS